VQAASANRMHSAALCATGESPHQPSSVFLHMGTGRAEVVISRSMSLKCIMEAFLKASNGRLDTTIELRK
jgi:hypothetical protein